MPAVKDESSLDYKDDPTPGSINIYADKLLMNYKMLLDYKKKYYQCSYCNVCGENTTTQCVGGYVSCNCSSCYNGHNTCKAGWIL